MLKPVKAWASVLLLLSSIALALSADAHNVYNYQQDGSLVKATSQGPNLGSSQSRWLLQSNDLEGEGHPSRKRTIPLRGRLQGEFVRVKHVIKLPDISQHIPYTCWTPVGVKQSSRIVSIVTIMFGTDHAHEFVRSNRLSYVKRHGYRYCELNHRLDPTRIAAWYKLPLVLALLPCSDYVIHVDADALLANHSISFEPVAAYMQNFNVDLMLSADIIRESPINFGVFAARPAKWVYELFQKLYNECACDWSRNFDWPAEQGQLYDFIVRDYMINAPDIINRTQIASMQMWNRHWMKWRRGDALIESTDLVVHFTGANDIVTGKSCGTNYTCRFSTIQKHHEKAISEKVVPKPLEYDTDKDFRKSVCHQIFFKQLVRADYTYTNRPNERHSSSFMDYQLNPRGAIKKIVIGEIACLGYRESRCRVPKYWNTQTGKGPWMPVWARPFKWYAKQQAPPGEQSKDDGDDDE